MATSDLFKRCEKMKKILFLLTMAFAGSLLMADDVTVQVINAVYEKSVTKELDDKIKKTGLEVHKKIENGRYVVTLGTFKNEREAQKALKMVRHFVSSDAFIRLVQRNEVAHLEKSIHSVQESEVVSQAQDVSSPAVEIHEKPAIVTVATIMPAVSTVATTPAISTQSESDKREVHKNELSEAINYYKNSPYHRFEPVILRQ